jgi:hypothetical protein
LRASTATTSALSAPTGNAAPILAITSASSMCRCALALAAHTGQKYQQARAHHGLGQVSHADGDPSQARRHWQEALALFTELGTPEARQVRAQLAAARDGYRGKQETSR